MKKDIRLIMKVLVIVLSILGSMGAHNPMIKSLIGELLDSLKE